MTTARTTPNDEDTVPTYRGTRLHALRIDDELWAAARARADAEGTSVNAEVVAFLRRWVARPPRGTRARKGSRKS